MQWPLFGIVRPQPLYRRFPLRMTGKIFVAITGNFLGEQLNFATLRAERIGPRAFAELLEEHEIFLWHRQFDKTALPETVEVRPFHARTVLRFTAFLVNMAQPGVLVAALSELFTVAQTFSQIGKNVEVITCLMLRRDGLMHRQHEAVAGGTADVITLKRGGGRQHDVGHFGGRSPDVVLYDHRVRFLPALHKPVKLLMMMERITARPVHQMDIRIVQRFALKLIRLARLE